LLVKLVIFPTFSHISVNYFEAEITLKREKYGKVKGINYHPSKEEKKY